MTCDKQTTEVCNIMFCIAGLKDQYLDTVLSLSTKINLTPILLLLRDVTRHKNLWSIGGTTLMNMCLMVIFSHIANRVYNSTNGDRKLISMLVGKKLQNEWRMLPITTCYFLLMATKMHFQVGKMKREKNR